jgi:hypothetical protein
MWASVYINQCLTNVFVPENHEGQPEDVGCCWARQPSFKSTCTDWSTCTKL